MSARNGTEQQVQMNRRIQNLRKRLESSLLLIEMVRGQLIRQSAELEVAERDFYLLTQPPPGAAPG